MLKKIIRFVYGKLNVVTFETWLMEPCEDEVFRDMHTQYFSLKRRHAKMIAEELGYGFRYFIQNYDFDMSAQMYEVADELDMILEEWVSKSSI